MKKPIYLNFQFSKFIWLLLLVTGFNGAAFGANFTVTKTADTNDNVCNADCSLREAIAAANAAAGDDVINFDASLFATTQMITLTNGSLFIANNSNLSINGTGANLLTVSGNNASIVFFIQSSANVVINDLKISDGKISGNGSGAGIANLGGTVTINNSEISNNSTNLEPSYYNSGGGIYNNGTMTINNSVVSNNRTSGQGGGIANDDGSVSGRDVILTINNSIIRDNTTNGSGGGIYSANGLQGTLNLSNTTVNNNTARFAGGIAISSKANLINVTVTNNTSQQGYGGGISNSNFAAPITITDSVINNNRANLGGGGLFCGDGARTTITNSTVSGNTAVQGGGGGIRSYRGTLNINSSIVSGNTAPGNSGGGLYSESVNSRLNVTNSVVRGNSALNGGGVLNDGSVTVITDSTINDNSATNGIGGGIYNFAAGNNITVTNSTVSNNVANSGGGIYNGNYNTTSLVNSTISGNSAASEGGGIYNGSTSAIVNARNSIIGDNTVNNSTGTAPDLRGALTSQGYNLIENTTGASITGLMTGNITGQDPQIVPLRSNGGTTETVALQPTSPAIDAADPTNFPSTDQRGVARPQDGDLNGTALPDIGAYERQVNVFATTKITDTNDGVCNADCSLREAIAAINAATTPDNVIAFDSALFNTPQTVNLTNGQLSINNANGTFFISGPGANLLSISGNNQSRVLYIGAGANATISGVTISGGNGIGAVNSGVGGGIYNNGGRLTFTSSIVSGNRTTNGNGGGIRNDNGGILTVVKSTIGNNISDRDGGGIFNFGDGSIVNVSEATINNNSASSGGGIYNFSTLNLTNSTVSGNSVILFGGGIFNDGLFGATSNLNSSTISNNTASGGGGGIGNASGTVNARNNIVADNIATNSAPDFSGALTSPAYNLIENTNGTTISGTSIGNILGQDPQLAPLGNYGGATQTQALRPNSPAIDKGNSFGVTADQRGRIRPYDFPNIANAPGGNGADIGAFERQATDVSGATLFDFDGDGKSDVSVFRPENGTWYLQQSQNGFAGVSFGLSNDRIVPADYDGDGKTDVAVFRAGTWYLQRSQLGFTGVAFGAAADIPVPADYDGDGKADVAVFRPSSGTWYLLQSTAGFAGIAFGQAGDKPVAADYDGDGKADVAVYRSGIWYIQRSQLGFTGIAFGENADKPVPADYDGDGKADVAVFRPSSGTWYLQRSQLGFTGIAFGLGTDLPVAADYDGDGKTDVAVFRNGTWYLNRSTQGFTGVAFGAAEDRPIPNAYVQ